MTPVSQVNSQILHFIFNLHFCYGFSYDLETLIDSKFEVAVSAGIYSFQLSIFIMSVIICIFLQLFLNNLDLKSYPTIFCHDIYYFFFKIIHGEP